jgi:hypothetical protein
MAGQSMSKNLLFLLQSAADVIEKRRLQANDTFLAMAGVGSPHLQIFYFNQDGEINEVPITESSWGTPFAICDVCWGGQYLAVLVSYSGALSATLRIYKVTPESAVECTVTGGTNMTERGIYKFRFNHDGSKGVLNAAWQMITTMPSELGPFTVTSTCSGNLLTPRLKYFMEVENDNPPPDTIMVEVDEVAWQWWNGSTPQYYAVGHYGVIRTGDTEFLVNKSNPDPYWLSYPTPVGDEIVRYYNNASPPDTGVGSYGIRFTSDSDFTWGGSGGVISDPVPYHIRFASVLGDGKVCYKHFGDTSKDGQGPFQEIYSNGWYISESQTPNVIAPSSLSSPVSGNMTRIAQSGDYKIMIGQSTSEAKEWVDIYEGITKLSPLPGLSGWYTNGAAYFGHCASMDDSTNLVALPSVDGCWLYVRDGTSFTRFTDLPDEWPVDDWAVDFAVFSGDRF